MRGRHSLGHGFDLLVSKNTRTPKYPFERASEDFKGCFPPQRIAYREKKQTKLFIFFNLSTTMCQFDCNFATSLVPICHFVDFSMVRAFLESNSFALQWHCYASFHPMHCHRCELAGGILFRLISSETLEITLISNKMGTCGNFSHLVKPPIFCLFKFSKQYAARIYIETSSLLLFTTKILFIINILSSLSKLDTYNCISQPDSEETR